MFPSFTRDIQRTLLRNTKTHLSGLSLKDCHPLWCAFPGNFGLTSEDVSGSTTPQLPHISMRDSVCSVPRSIAFTDGISVISFPAGTKMFQSPAFPLITQHSEE
jgi:hypothetical protein